MKQNINTNNFNIEINNDAPVVASEKIIINASSDQVRSILIDIENWSFWRKNIEVLNVENVDEMITFYWKSDGLKYKSIVHTDTEFLFGWTGTTIGASAIHNWKINTVGEKTEVEVFESLQGIAIKLMRKKMKLELPKMLRKDLQDLKKKCENESGVNNVKLGINS